MGHGVRRTVAQGDAGRWQTFREGMPKACGEFSTSYPHPADTRQDRRQEQAETG